MSNKEFINNIFGELIKYLNQLKPALDNFTTVDDSYPELRPLLLQHKEILSEIRAKMSSYSEDVKSSIQKIDSILNNSSGGARLTKRRNKKRQKSKKIRR